MESRERVLTVLRGQRPDRVPLRLNARREVLDALQAYLHLPDDEAVHRRLGIDIRQFGGVTFARGKGFGARTRTVESVSGITNSFAVEHPLGRVTDPRELPDTLSRPEELNTARLAALVDASAGHFVMVKVGDVFQQAFDLRGMEALLTDLALDNGVGEEILRRLAATVLQRVHLICRSPLAAQIDAIQFNDDLGTQKGLFMSPAMTEHYLFSLYKPIFAAVKEYGKWLFMHSCGAIAPLIPRLREMGVDILNPVQWRAEGMDLASLQRLGAETGLTYCGGVDVQRTLPFGSAEDVRREVELLIDNLGWPGRFIIDSTNFLQPDTPPESILAMFEHAQEYSRAKYNR